MSTETIERSNKVALQRRPFAIEIGGPAGAGKTTLLREIGERHPTIAADARLHRVRDLPWIAGNTLPYLPTFLANCRRMRWFTWTETRSMTYLKAWLYDLSRRPKDSDTITIFDHGPIFRLVILREFGPQLTRTKNFDRWWQNVLQSWAKSLNMVVWLDAPDDILLTRIRQRPRWHRFKDTNDDDAIRFMHEYRQSCKDIIGQLTANGGPKIIQFNTEEVSTEQVAEIVLEHFRPSAQ